MSNDLIEQGKTYLSGFELQEAEAAFQQAAAADPPPVEALVWLGRVFLMKEEHEKALDYLNRALNLQPDHAEVLALKGIYSMQMENYHEAILWLEEAKKASPNLEMIYFNMARSYRKLGQYEKAEEAAKRGLELRPQDSETLFELGRIYVKTGRMVEALQSLLNCIRINPRFLRAYLILGDLYIQAGKGNLVIELYKEGLRHNPNAFILQQELCNLYALKLDFQSAHSEALEMTKKRQYYGDYLRLGMYCLAVGKIQEAEAAFRKSVELNPKSWEGHYNLAELYRTAKLFDPARAEYQLAIEHGGNNYKPFNGMGVLLLHDLKDTAEAQKYFLRALEISPSQVEPMFNMALACGMANDKEAAKKFASAVLKLTPPDSDPHDEASRLLKALA